MTLPTTVGTFNNPTPSSLSADKSLHPTLTCHLTSRLRPETAILLQIQNLFDYHTWCPNPITLLRIGIYHLDRDHLLIPDILNKTSELYSPLSHLNM